MTVSSSTNRDDYAGNGSTTSFAVSFRFLENSHIKATLRDALSTETLQVETTDYTLTGAGGAGGGTLEMLVAPITGTTLTILRDVPATQETDYVENDEFPAEAHEDALDKLTMLVQQQGEDSTRHIGFSDTVSDATGSAVELSQDATQRADTFIGFDALGNIVTKTASVAGLVDQAQQDNRYGPIFATVAAMIAANPVSLDGIIVVPVVGMVVAIDDYATGNGSGIMFGRVVAAATGTADGGSYIDLDNGLQFEQNFPAKLSVKLFGLVGDGVADDTAGIVTVIAYAEANSRALWFPAGTYTSTAAISLDTLTDISIFGDSKYTTTWKYTGTFSPPSTLNFVRVPSSNNIYVEGITIDCNSTTQALEPSRGISIFESDDVEFFDVDVRGYTVGGGLAFRDDNNPNLDQILIRNSRFFGVAGESDACFVLTDCDNSRISNCYGEESVSFGFELKNSCKHSKIENSLTRSCALAFSTGFQTTAEFPDVAGNGARNCLIDGCVASGGAAAGFSLSRAKETSIRGCKVDMENIVPGGATVFDNGDAIRIDNCVDCVVEVDVENVNSAALVANLDTSDCTVTINSLRNVAATNIFRFAGAAVNNSIYVNDADFVVLDTKALLVDDADSTTNRVFQKKLLALKLQAAGTLYDMRLDYGTVGHSGGANYTRQTTTATVTNQTFVINGVTSLDIRQATVDPGTDNASSCGRSGKRWSEVFAANGTINTSDERKKTSLEDLDATERAVAVELKSAIKKFRFLDAVEKKGDDARIHIGVGVQTVGAIFESHGLDPHKYALFCYDSWGDEYDGDGVLVTEAGDLYGIRYDQLLAFIIGSM